MPGVPRHATIIIPAHDHGLTLRYPLASLKRQTLGDFAAFVIGDGVPDSLKAALRELVADDERFHFIDHPKHIRRGEPYRHEVLRSAADGIVCYLADHDIWLPDHLEQMWGLLQSADYAHSLPLHIPGRSSGEIRCSLARPTLILVPPGVWHGVHNIGHEPATLVNMVDRAYRYEDPDHWRLPADTGEIPYRFSAPSGTTDAQR